jgi:hypothetical protein
MSTKMLTRALLLAATAGLPACSTPPTPKSEMTFASTPLAPPIYKLPDDGQTPDSPRLVFGHLCKLGTSCLALDPRPFEPCLLSTKHCTEKGIEPMLVAPPKIVIVPPQVESY